MPPTIVMEAVAQVGALLVLAKPEHHDKVPYLVGIDRICAAVAAAILFTSRAV
jgi:hypothetical protein